MCLLIELFSQVSNVAHGPFVIEKLATEGKFLEFSQHFINGFNSHIST